MAERKKENKFEFVLYINEFKVISRYFTADEYNPKIRNSVDIRNLADSIIAQIQDTIKQRDAEFMWEGYDLRENGYFNKWNDEIKSAKKYVENNKKSNY